MKIKKEIIILLLIVLVGAYLRLFGVFTNSFAYTYDVGRDLLALFNIIHQHKIPLIGATTGLPGIFYGPWWYYLLLPFYILVAGNPAGIDFVMAMIGISSIIFAYKFGEKLEGKFLALILAGITSVSPVMVSLSSQIWNPNIAPFFVFLTLLVLEKIFSDKTGKNLKYFLALGLLIGLNVDIEIVWGVLFAFGIIFALIINLKKKIRVKNVLSFLLGILIISSPRIFFELRHQFLMTKSFIAFITSGNGSHQASNLISTIFGRILILFDQFRSTLVQNEVLGFLLTIFIAICLIWGYKKQEKIIKNFIVTTIVILVTFIFGLTFFSHDIWPHYLVGLPVFYILLFSLSLLFLSQKLKNIIVPVALFIILFLVNLNPLSIYKTLTTPLWTGDASVYRNQLAVVDYVYKDAEGKNFKYVVYTPPVHDYTYQYLFNWYGEKKYKYVPKDQENLAYFILEPDTQYPQRLQDWLKVRVGDGKIIRSKKLDSGIIIQTRVH